MNEILRHYKTKDIIEIERYVKNIIFHDKRQEIKTLEPGHFLADI